MFPPDYSPSVVNTNFLFEEGEFDSDAFNAEAFIAKYRRVAPLESVKDELVQYKDILNERLHGLINRDYKDFISITSKLEGVDSRVDHMHGPLLDLKIHVSAIYEGLVANIKIIESKISKRNEVSYQRQQLETLLNCIAHVDAAKTVIVPATSTPTGAANRMMTRREKREQSIKLLSLGGITGCSSGNNEYAKFNMSVSDSKEKEELQCAEWERAANALQRAKACLQTAVSHPAVTVENPPTNNHKALMQGLANQISELSEKMCNILVTRVTDMISNYHSVCAAVHQNNNSDICAGFPMRSFKHCVRAFMLLEKGFKLENIVSEFVSTYLKTHMTVLKMDGLQTTSVTATQVASVRTTGNRGSFLGLHDLLNEEMMHTLVHGTLLPVILVTEQQLMEVSCSNIVAASGGKSSVDILMKSIYEHITTHLLELCPNNSLFSSGIAAIFHRCYVALDKFHKLMGECILDVCNASGEGDQWSLLGEFTKDRFRQHSLVTSFQSKWNTKLYYQLRSREVVDRLDACCKVVSQVGWGTNTSEVVYKLTPSNNSQKNTSNSSLPADESLQLLASIGKDLTSLAPSRASTAEEKTTAVCFYLPIFSSVAMEMCICLNDSVYLTSLRGEFFTLVMKIMYRIHFHMLESIGVVGAMKLLNQSAAEQGRPIGVVTTPVKSSKSATATAGGSSVTSLSSSAFELYQLSHDVQLFSEWLLSCYVQYAESRLLVEKEMDKSTKSPVYECVLTQTKKFETLVDVIWQQIASVLGSECRQILVVVETIPGQYRMTSKSAPTQCGSYVKRILDPVRSFLQTCAEHVSCFSVRQGKQWQEVVVTNILELFVHQVQKIMKTVRQMDNTLQKRSRAIQPSSASAAGGTATISDSDKMSLQLLLDVKEFRDEVVVMLPALATPPGFNSSDGTEEPFLAAFPLYGALLSEVIEAEKHLKL